MLNFVSLPHNLSRTLLQLRCRSLPLCVSSKMSRLSGICGDNKFHALDISDQKRKDVSLFDLKWGGNVIERELTVNLIGRTLVHIKVVVH